jgi:type I restriction enzyme S subunit
VSDVCERVTVGVVIRPASYYVNVGVPALRTLNIKPGLINESELVYFSKADNDGPLAKSKLRAGDVVVSRTGRAGVAAVIPPHLAGANAIDLIVITPQADRVDSKYFEALLNSPIGTQLVAGEQRGQIQQHFNVGSLKSAKLPFPSLDRQQEFAERIRRLQAITAEANAQLAQLDTCFSSLQSRAFSGHL